MNYPSCPTTVINAPIEAVWTMLTNPLSWDKVFDIRIQDALPRGPASPGQIVRGESGPKWMHLKVSIEIVAIYPTEHRIKMKIRLPLRLFVHEDLDCVPVDSASCRVNYRCDFEFPAGWRRSVLRLLMSRELKRGPENSLRRLKDAAEREQRFMAAKT